MYCINCGKKVLQKQKFCAFCGTKCEVIDSQEKSVEAVNTKTESITLNNVFNRDVLINYLYNIRLLEVTKTYLNNHISDNYNRIQYLGYKKDYYKPKLDTEGILYAVGGVTGVTIATLVIGNILNATLGDWFGWTEFFNGLMTFIIVAAFIIAAIYIGNMLFEKSQDESKYELNIKSDNVRVENELKEKSILQSEVAELCENLGETEALLSEAYSVNLIPSKYRNVYAAYFLYDYISTSTASLNEALLHCDLDTIVTSLGTIIAQQQEMIMELARSNALNQQIIQQNESILQHSINVENNTALAAQYSQIAATNSKVTAYCQTVEFLKS